MSRHVVPLSSCVRVIFLSCFDRVTHPIIVGSVARFSRFPKAARRFTSEGPRLRSHIPPPLVPSSLLSPERDLPLSPVRPSNEFLNDLAHPLLPAPPNTRSRFPPMRSLVSRTINIVVSRCRTCPRAQREEPCSAPPVSPPVQPRAVEFRAALLRTRHPTRRSAAFFYIFWRVPGSHPSYLLRARSSPRCAPFPLPTVR